MIVGSIKENTTLEKRVSITPDSAKNIISLGLKICIEKNYANHLGIKDEELIVVKGFYEESLNQKLINRGVAYIWKNKVIFNYGYLKDLRMVFLL